jgi:hypothetical protein
MHYYGQSSKAGPEGLPGLAPGPVKKTEEPLAPMNVWSISDPRDSAFIRG